MFRAFLYIFFVIAGFALSGTAKAAYHNQFSFHGGIAHSTITHKLGGYGGAEFEHRLGLGVGIGLVGNYIALKPNTVLLGAPEFFLHPGGRNWFLNVAPIFQSQPGKFSVGVRTGTRFLFFSSRILKIQVRLEADFINGGNRYLGGVGIEFHTI